MKETIYICNINDKETLRKMHLATLQLKIRLKVIAADLYSQKVGFITELDGYEKETPLQDEIPAITDEVMIMKNLSRTKMDALLAAFRKTGVPKIKLKAVLTETNKNWYFYELCQELQREHEKLNQEK